MYMHASMQVALCELAYDITRVEKGAFTLSYMQTILHRDTPLADLFVPAEDDADPSGRAQRESTFAKPKAPAKGSVVPVGIKRSTGTTLTAIDAEKTHGKPVALDSTTRDNHPEASYCFRQCLTRFYDRSYFTAVYLELGLGLVPAEPRALIRPDLLHAGTAVGTQNSQVFPCLPTFPPHSFSLPFLPPPLCPPSLLRSALPPSSALPSLPPSSSLSSPLLLSARPSSSSQPSINSLRSRRCEDSRPREPLDEAARSLALTLNLHLTPTAA